MASATPKSATAAAIFPDFMRIFRLAKVTPSSAAWSVPEKNLPSNQGSGRTLATGTRRPGVAARRQNAIRRGEELSYTNGTPSAPEKGARSPASSDRGAGERE